MNYLKATGLKVCLLVDFGRPRVEVKRIVLDYECGFGLSGFWETVWKQGGGNE